MGQCTCEHGKDARTLATGNQYSYGREDEADLRAVKDMRARPGIEEDRMAEGTSVEGRGPTKCRPSHFPGPIRSHAPDHQRIYDGEIRGDKGGQLRNDVGVDLRNRLR